MLVFGCDGGTDALNYSTASCPRHTDMILPYQSHYTDTGATSRLFNDRFHLSFFVATHGFRESDFDYYSISYSSAH